ncbi:MAG TPA: TusE/DsrC/DsvC family sulfur relay protein [Nitrospirota bacterium]|jgi:tRNA 2-thiouridine synthesizing protein E|nr:TusE/DsrC/DsvC family sulfur relay protein [Nitrospirota bacterium]
MATLTVKEKTYEVDESGYLANIDEWNVDVANYYAEVEGIAMSDQHWEIVNFLREYYKRYQIAPMIKILVKEIGNKFGPQMGNTKYLYELFPDGPAKQACKIAGLPKPTGCV